MEPFKGLGTKLVPFLKDLEHNNNRAWFNKNKARYQECVQEPMLAFIRAIGPKLEKVSPHIAADDRKVGGSLMRIHRDVRFAKDKRPYNTHVAAIFRHERGKKVTAPGFYIRIDPKEVWLGTGIWKPDGPALAKIRRRIDGNGAEWKKVRDNKVFVRLYGGLAGDSLKRPPRGFHDTHPYIEDLKRKDLAAFRILRPSKATPPLFVDEAVKTYEASSPLMGFICKALGLGY